MTVATYTKEASRDSAIKLILLEFGDVVTLEQLYNASDEEIKCMLEEISNLTGEY